MLVKQIRNFIARGSQRVKNSPFQFVTNIFETLCIYLCRITWFPEFVCMKFVLLAFGVVRTKVWVSVSRSTFIFASVGPTSFVCVCSLLKVSKFMRWEEVLLLLFSIDPSNFCVFFLLCFCLGLFRVINSLAGRSVRWHFQLFFLTKI